MTQAQLTTTQMGILSEEVYKDDEYFLDSNGNRKKPIIETAYGDYTIIESRSTTTDMQALLLQGPDGKFVIAFRGTEGTAGDILSDIMNGFVNYNPQIADARDFVNKMMYDYNITASNLTLTGHSLGGMLTQAIGSEMRIPGYAFNPYGMERLMSMPGAMSLLTALGPVGVLAQVLSYDILIKLGVSAPNAQWAKDNIVNVSYTDSGALNGDILSNLTTNLTSGHIGAFVPLIGEDTGLLGGHSIFQMNYAIAIYNEILSHFTVGTTYETLSDAYLVNQYMGQFFSNNVFVPKDMYDMTNQYLFADANIYHNNGSALSFNLFHDLTNIQIASQAKNDAAVLFALIRLNGFAVEGNLSSYNNLNRDNYSSLYIEDRSLLLYKMLDSKTHNIGDWFIRDMTYGITVNDDGWHYDNNQIIFGADGNNLLEGNDKANKIDHLFGMEGTDILNGYAGDDVLDGGAGNDILLGGEGFDTYYSGDGDTIDDSDGKGEVNFEGFKLTGGAHTGTYETFKTYEGDGGMYILRSDGTLIFSKNGNFLTIENYSKEENSLGIELTGDNLELSIFAPVVSENVGVATGAITLSHAYSEDVIVTLYTQDDTATAGSDYVGRPTFDVRIAAGETYVTFDISILDNQEPEPTETFYTLVDTVRTANGTHVDFTLTDVQPFTIEDDDADNNPNDPNDPSDPTDPKYVTVSVSNGQNVESGETISFVVSLSEVLSEDISIDFITQDGSAITGEDYVQYGRYGVTIPAGQRSAVYQVVLLNDEVPEDTENFSLTPYSLSYTGSENVLLSNSATGTIYDDDDSAYVTVHISDASAQEQSERMTFTVSLSKELTNDITISTSLGDVTILAGGISTEIYASWSDDTIVELDESFTVALTGCLYSGSEQVLLLNTSIGTIIDDDPEANPDPEPNPSDPHPHPYDPDEPQPHDPLVLDLNQDGKISTIALENSQVYFDLTGDGVKERVGWIAPEDGLLVYDKNMNGKIDGVSEVFGKDGLSGFSELRAVADTNYDSIIDRRDALFSQLKVWQDSNSDGISQASELKSLSQAGVKNIELNVIGTNINLNGNLLSEAGRYGDIAGERELAADIQLLATERVNSSSTPDTYTIDPITETLPQMRGYGYIDNSFKAYNLDPKLKELALSFMNDKERASANFGEFILRWSGFYDMAKSKGISEEQFSPYLYEVPSLKLWILERFVGSHKDGWRSEVHLSMNTNGGYHTQDFGNEAYIHEHFNLLMERYEAMFSIQAYYTDVFSDTHYDISIDEFVIDDTTAFTTKLTEYLNNAAIAQNDKLYLASMMNNLEGTFLHFDAAAMIDSITDTTLKSTITDIMDEKIHFQFAKDSGYYSYDNTHVYGDNTNELITINSKTFLVMDAQNGDDLIRDNAGGNTTYMYRKGSGSDTIYDAGGADILNLENITLEEVNIEVKNTDLIITLKSDPTDQIRIVDWKKIANRIETIRFAGENQLDLGELLFPKTEGDDYIELTNGDDTVDTLGGNDTVYAGEGNDTLFGGSGNDTLFGGAGNDTYLFEHGDGRDTLTDTSGTDTIRFGDGIVQNDLIVKIVGVDMFIAIREEGKALDELNDMIIVKNWMANTANRIETIILSDGTSLAIESLQSVSDGNDLLLYENTAVNLDLLGGDDTVTSGNTNDIIVGGSGNDTLSSGSGNDTLSGGRGDDTLLAGEGNDTLSGAEGIDTLYGGSGDDLYLYSRGDGKDIIIDEYRYGYNGANQSNAGNDILRFGEGITQDDLIAIIRPESDDLIIALKEDGKTFEELNDVITIKNWVNTNNRIEAITLSDGSVVDLAAIQSATDGNDNLIFGDNPTTIDALGGDDTVITGLANDALHGGDGHDTLRSGGGDDTLTGDGGNDTLVAGSGNDILSGGEGNDTLYGESGNDTLAGNAGTDTLIGGLGDETYLFNLGDGHDMIIDEYTYGSGGNDTLRFGEGITKADLVARAVSGSNDLQIGVRESGKGFDALGDIVTLKNWFDANKRIENITLSDGSVVTLSEMQGGTDGDDYLVFGDSDTVIDAMGGNDTVISANGNDTLSGGAGNDILISNNGNDTLYGGEGNDTLKAGAGNDILSGGVGVDTLEGGIGNDTYHFALGDGKDRIIDTAGNDTLIFGEAISADDLIARVVSGSDDLQIALREDGKTFDQLSDIITISGWRNAAYRVENLRLSDGTAVALTQIQRSSEGDDYLVFGDEGVIIDALAGNDTLIIGDGNDTANGGDGNDMILSGKGNDILSGGKGTDTLKGGTGNDTYTFNRGDGADTIFDELGTDTLSFGDGITKDDLIFKQQGNNLLIGIAEINKTFDQLSDVITLTDWFKSYTNIEIISFADNTSISQSDVASLFVANDIHGALYSKPGAIMYGGSGDNTYIYNRGDFTVVIDDQYQQGQIDVNAGNDTLYLSGGINKSNVTFGVVGNDLILKVAPNVETYEQLRDYVVIKNWANTNKGIEKVIFSNGEMVTIDKNGSYPATTFNYGWVSSQYFIYGDDVNVVAGSAVDETFETNGGNDTINAGGGNDRIYAGAGNDIIEGGAGNDVYHYNRGEGKDTVYDLSGNDTLLFGKGITANDLVAQASGNNLIIALKEDGKTFANLSDKIILTDWYNVNNRIETISFADGSILNTTNAIVDLMSTDGDDTIKGTDNNETIMTGEGNDTIIASFGNDILVGGIGNDTLYGSNGNETYVFNRGDGTDTISDVGGIDTLMLGEGITSNDLIIQASGNNLIIALKDEGKVFEDLSDKITITDWYNVNNKIENLSFENGEATIKVDTIVSDIVKADNNAMKFDGVDDALIISNPQDFNVTTGLTLMSTFSYNGMGTGYQSDLYGMLVTKAYTNYASSYFMALDSTGKLLFQVVEVNNTSHRIYSNTIFHTGEMYDVAATYDKATGISRIYINGVIDTEVNVGTFEIMQSSQAVVIGAYWGGYSGLRSNFNGTVSDVKIYDKALSETEVSTMENGSTSSSGLLAHYDFEGTNPLMNKSGNEFMAMVVGNPVLVNANTAYTPPLIFDLNANGMTSTSLNDSHTYFDYAADGLKEHTAWIEKGDALLVRDINNDGVINDGSELFGDRTKLSDGSLAADGYAALAQYDTNNDGVIDKNDTDFSQLKLWKDANQNGKTDAGELVDLSVAGITSLSLNRTDGAIYTQTTENGNIVTNETNYSTLTDTGTMRDVWFKIDETDTITDNDTIYGTSEAETLSGDVGNDTYVIAYGGGADVIDDNGTGDDTIKFISGITTDRLVVQWVRGTDDLRIGIRENAEDDTPITELSNTITIKNWFNETGAIEQFSFSDGTTLNRQGIYDLLLNVEGDLTLRVLDADGSLSGNSGNDVLYGVEGNELLSGKEGDDYLRGLGGDDYLSGAAGDDTLEGGEGNDTLEGGINDDYYLFDKGDGKDLIIDAGGMDTLYFGTGVNSRDVIINEVGEDLVLTFGYDVGKSIEEIDQITIKNWNIDDFKIESLSFSDGNEYSISELIEKNTNHTPEMFFEEGERNLGKERSAKGILLADDIDGDTLTYTVTSAPTMGTISINQYGIWTYTGTSNKAGTDTITIAIQDGRGGEVTTTLSFVMDALNQAPEAPSDISNTLQDIRVLSGEVGATDIDGDVLSYTISTEASHGTLSVNELGVWNYAAAEGYMGTDSAVIAIDDGNGGVIAQTLNFDIKVSAPTLSDTTSNLLEDTNATGVLSVVNPIGGTLVYEVLNASAKGSFSVNESGEWSYTPNADLNGSDSITVKVTNAYGLSSTATVSLAIEAVNDAPILTETPAQVTLYAGSSTFGVIKASDVDGDVLSYSVTANPEHGTLSIDDQGHWNYTAERYYAGESSATLTIDDGHAESITTTLNFANLMTPDWHYTYSGQSMSINDNDGVDVLLMNDISMSELTFLQEGNNLRIDVKNKNDVILTDYFTSPTKGVESLQTKDGTINLSKDKIGKIGGFWNIGWGSSANDLIVGESTANGCFFGGAGDDTLFGNRGHDTLLGYTGNDLLIGGDGNDCLSGGNDNDILYGDNGNDTLNGEAGNDKLFGGKDNDTLSGGEGNDLLNGGEGTNFLSGSSGNDTYLFTQGATNTTINENTFGFNLFGRWIGQNGGNDTVKFGEGITKEDISFLMKGNDLLLQYGHSEFITIQNQKNEGNRIEKMELNDGSYLTNTDMDKIIQQLSAYSKDHGFHLTNNTQIQNNQALMNIVASGWHTL